MNIPNSIEAKLRDSLTIHSLSEIPGFPFKSYDEVLDLHKSGGLSVGCKMNENVVDNFGSGAQKIMEKLLLSSPIVAIIASIATAIFISNYTLLIGIPLSVFGMFMTTPAIMKSGKGFGGTILGFSFVAFVYFCYRGDLTPAFLLGTYWVPNFLLTVSREQSRMVMEEAIMSSELVLIYYYDMGLIHLSRK